MMLVGLSGAQGGGKSSLLLELKERGWYLDSFRVSRAVQKSLGWDSLARVMDSPRTMMQFQDEVFKQKYENDFTLLRPGMGIALTERTFADILAYTMLWTHKFVDEGRMSLDEAMRYLMPFTRQCQEAQKTIYGGTMLLPLMDHVQWEDDTNRASKTDAARVYDDIERFLNLLPVSHPSFVITDKSIAGRADQVEKFLKGLFDEPTS